MQQTRKIVVVLKGYPRLSETFIAQELLGLERAGFELVLVALRRPTDTKRHPVHDEIRAPVHYLPEYLHEEPMRLARAVLACLPKQGFWRGLAAMLGDFRRDRSRNRIRRFGQAAVLAAEWPQGAGWLHAHFIHTPASVAAYASLISGTPWTCSAHAKDIWTSPDWELAGKLASTRWTVTCTQTGFDHLRILANGKSPVHLSYHGLDLARFAPFSGERLPKDGSASDQPVTILSVGRAVEKKGFDILLRALSLLPADLNWRFEHIGDGGELKKLQALATELGIAGKLSWRGALDQKEVLSRYREADIFALPCRITADGDRDGLPNVLVEASSQRLVCISTNISGIPELLIDGENGFVVPPEDPQAFAAALETAIRNPSLRVRLGDAAEHRVRTEFDHHASIRQLKDLFEAEWQATP
ncbi:glycosyltransferase family 4 protein [Pararhizobium antarcticum]|uniref:Colanic acid biosynthesis glycosyltransferase WcaL n=1 Tax=Pararhizobium antarcticum TaxID=1798805 RepID=A0A657LMI3_9HYPH|nr:glycosyltransferase family 4 protein [Pararhizobium antarcticum]OJF92350.1 colanic acid biosynthesis glycosyltransferase WcaL [Pararhizobium antarcticum]OJF94770.1 colanic acid biosynthesis glycosyltransferase WcaL [Rhizobium sp. 58]